MSALERVRPALLYIDEHLEETLHIEDIAARFHFSAYYFHRVFTLIVGKSMAAYIRERRLRYAASWLHGTRWPLVDIAMRCGFESSQAFSRAFRKEYGMPPGAYRLAGILPELEPVEVLVRRFTNRLQGGIYVNPRIIKKEALCIVGKKGAWDKTAEVWNAFEQEAAHVASADGKNGYEVRVFNGEDNPVYAGYVSSADAPEGFASLRLPAGEYAAFEVFVSEGYMSENDAIRRWVDDNEQGYRERLLDGAHFVVELYDARFNGEESGSIVEIWVPVERK